MMDKEFVKKLVEALKHFGFSIVYLLFMIPFDMWKKAVLNLATQKENGALSISKINSPWPFFSFMKTLLLEFIFDAFAFVSYIIGILMFFVTIFAEGFGEAMLVLIGAYFAPVGFMIVRDLFQLLILPIRKYISWARKPAQQLDIDLKNKN